jgi:hypothetical protein
VLPTDTLATFHTRFWQAQMRSVEEDAERASSSAGPSSAPAAAQEEEEGKKGKGKGKGKRKEAAPVAPASAPGEKFKPGPGQLPLARIKVSLCALRRALGQLQNDRAWKAVSCEHA